MDNSESTFCIFFYFTFIALHCIILFKELPFPFYNCYFPFPVLYASLEMYVLSSCVEPQIYSQVGFFGFFLFVFLQGRRGGRGGRRGGREVGLFFM